MNIVPAVWNTVRSMASLSSSSSASDADRLLVDRIRRGEGDAWTELIARFEGRLIAYVDRRLRNRAASEDIVQDTFVGFVTSLPNYDARRSLEGYLFSICAYKLTDYLRKEGRRPSIPMSTSDDSIQATGYADSGARVASSIVRSGERKRLEEKALIEAMRELLQRWQERGEWLRVQCLELLFVRGWQNKDVARKLNTSEQAVANYKFDFIARMGSTIRKQGLNPDVFPELYS